MGPTVKPAFLQKLLFLLVVSFFVFIKTAGQYTICDCSTYASLQYQDDYKDIFPPEIIKRNNIKELTIYTTSKQSKPNDTTFKTVDKEYREMIFKFNSNGYVEAQILFNRLGQYHSINEFSRDNNNRILTKTFHYLDSLGVKDEDFLVDKWIYVYANDRLTKIKQLGDKFIEEPDNKSSYTTYSYDTKGRVNGTTRYAFYDFTDPFYYQTTIKYNDTTNTSVSTTKDKKGSFSIVKTKYTSDQKPLNVKYYQAKDNKLLEEMTYTYNTEGQLAIFQVKNSGMGTECPDGNNYDNTYSYSSLKLISSIRHHYKNTICELRFVYR